MHQESSDDDVVAMAHKAVPKEEVLVDKEQCMQCDTLMPWQVLPATTNVLHSLKRTCDKDKTGNLLSRLTLCRAKVPEQFKEVGLAMVDKQKHARTTTQREMIVSLLESTTSSLTVKSTRGVLLLTKAEHIKHQISTKHSMMATATQMWKTDFDNPDVRRDVEDGETVIAVRPPTTIDSEETRARSRQIQRVE